ncbi:P-type conjugative transfer protein TrbG [Sphingomonas colocasiae]|uniref:P-type conjugative transfer protein TrbG n=1 Tax=Sphingomonas colocasiae TaxID=1848973 RepID=A0ABS7PQE3_9SPHN|nr:P-type conjugative transfer protein TrbG [Sphingomonas colocasiae]MBY8823189.1 P-type conjugative transfer protein TrbG [Sphingomonas colocasiae]
MIPHILALSLLAGGGSPGPAAGVIAAERRATVEPASSNFINARQVYAWTEGAIYQAYVAPGLITEIALQPGESLIAVAAGDTVRWVIGDTSSGAGESKRTHILVKPYSVGLETNLVITTDRRVYHLRLTSVVRHAMTALAWTYPQDAMIAVKRAATDLEPVRPLEPPLAIDALGFGYVITGDRPAWRPLRAFDDGRQTYIEFPASIAVGEAPPLFLLGANGEAELINYRMRGRFYVVDRLFDAAELRLGASRQQVVRITRSGERSRRHGR